MVRPFRLHHKAETVSTNLDARAGVAGDVFTADWQSAGRGRLDHVWHSRAGENLMMSAVLDVSGLEPGAVATFPLVTGLAVVRSLGRFVRDLTLKWPNDVLVGGRKICGILCERRGENVIAGIGVNVRQRTFPEELSGRATSLALLLGDAAPSVATVRDAILSELAALHAIWRARGFAALWPSFAAIDALKGRCVRVYQTDGDRAPVEGLCGGINPDGTLDVGGRPVYAGEAHVGKYPLALNAANRV